MIRNNIRLAILLVLIIAAWIFPSCENKNKNKKMQIVFREWIGKEILFPDKEYLQKRNESNPSNSLCNRDYKILYY